MAVKDFYATAQYFTDCGKSNTLPAHHRYFLFVDFDERNIKLVNEQTLQGEWTLLSGRREYIDFSKLSISHGRELSELSEFTGQVYKRVPPKKTFRITQDDFLEAFSRRGYSSRHMPVMAEVSHMMLEHAAI
jgi:hypothetical protein